MVETDHPQPATFQCVFAAAARPEWSDAFRFCSLKNESRKAVDRYWPKLTAQDRRVVGQCRGQTELGNAIRGSLQWAGAWSHPAWRDAWNARWVALLPLRSRPGCPLWFRSASHLERSCEGPWYRDSRLMDARARLRCPWTRSRRQNWYWKADARRVFPAKWGSGEPYRIKRHRCLERFLFSSAPTMIRRKREQL